jgi:hypothetical protein
VNSTGRMETDGRATIHVRKLVRRE